MRLVTRGFCFVFRLVLLQIVTRNLLKKETAITAVKSATEASLTSSIAWFYRWEMVIHSLTLQLFNLLSAFTHAFYLMSVLDKCLLANTFSVTIQSVDNTKGVQSLCPFRIRFIAANNCVFLKGDLSGQVAIWVKHKHAESRTLTIRLQGNCSWKVRR